MFCSQDAIRQDMRGWLVCSTGYQWVAQLGPMNPLLRRFTHMAGRLFLAISWELSQGSGVFSHRLLEFFLAWWPSSKSKCPKKARQKCTAFLQSAQKSLSTMPTIQTLFIEAVIKVPSGSSRGDTDPTILWK